MRIIIIKIFFALFLFAISTRLFYWQIVKASQLQARAENQYFKDVKVGAIRGKILYSDNFILVSTNPVYNVFANPKLLYPDQKIAVAHNVAKIIKNDDVDLNELEILIKEKLSKDLYWILLGKNLNIEEKNEIEKLKLPGIGFEQLSGRFYPEGSMAAHLLGFVAADAKGQSAGYFGVEGYYDRELRGVTGSVRSEKDAFGLPILIGNFFENNVRDGNDLVLNIDRTVQFYVEQALKTGIEKYRAKAASAIVMEPKTGAILALATFPNYDPLNYYDFPKEYFKNSIVADQYEPGSTFKVLVMAAAVNEELVKPDTKCDICEGPVNLGGFTIRTWNNKYYPDTSMKDVIVHSDNTGMVFTAQKLGLDKFYSYIENFGFNGSTGVDLQDESSPGLRSKKDWREIDLATASFGQGIAVTPIQMIRAVSAIANGGNLVEPHIVKKIIGGRGEFEIRPKIIRQVLKESTTKVITEMMVAAVKEGEAKYLKINGFKIAGKTGTAQIPVAGHYDPDKTIASFIGFAPANDPKFVILVRYDQPTSSIYGAETAAPTFFEITKDLLSYYKIAPTE